VGWNKERERERGGWGMRLLFSFLVVYLERIRVAIWRVP
jgi:hypothetical protein